MSLILLLHAISTNSRQNWAVCGPASHSQSRYVNLALFKNWNNEPRKLLSEISEAWRSNVQLTSRERTTLLRNFISSTAWNEQFRGIYGTVIFHDTRRILDRDATCQDKSRSGYVKCSVSREIRALILNGTDLLSEWAKLLHFDAHFLRTTTGS